MILMTHRVFQVSLLSTTYELTEMCLGMILVRPSSPSMIGDWGPYYEPCHVMVNGKHIFKFFCINPGPSCATGLSKHSSLSTLKYHFEHKHHAAYIEKNKKKDGPTQSTPTLVQTHLNMAPIPQAKCDKIVTVTLEWLIRDLLPFSTLDLEHYKAMVRAYIPNLAPPCAATVHSSLLNHQLALTE